MTNRIMEWRSQVIPLTLANLAPGAKRQSDAIDNREIGAEDYVLDLEWECAEGATGAVAIYLLASSDGERWPEGVTGVDSSYSGDDSWHTLISVVTIAPPKPATVGPVRWKTYIESLTRRTGWPFLPPKFAILVVNRTDKPFDKAPSMMKATPVPSYVRTRVLTMTLKDLAAGADWRASTPVDGDGLFTDMSYSLTLRPSKVRAMSPEERGVLASVVGAPVLDWLATQEEHEPSVTYYMTAYSDGPSSHSDKPASRLPLPVPSSIGGLPVSRVVLEFKGKP